MRYLNAAQAARILGIGDKTIRRWLKEGKRFPSAILTANREYAIPEDEVERVRQQRFNPHGTPSFKDQSPDITSLAAKVAELEQEVRALKSTATATEQKHMQSDTSALPVTHNRPLRRKSDTSERELPEGCILARHFAEMYSVAPMTFRDHYMKGLGPKRQEKEKVAVSSRPKPGREKEIEYYLTPDQQVAALAFWKRHGVQYQTPAEEIVESSANETPAA